MTQTSTSAPSGSNSGASAAGGPPKRHTRVVYEAATDTGNVRSVNEDRFWITPESFDAIAVAKKGQLFVVADGMGGYAAGDVAAEIVSKTMGESYYGEQTDAAADIAGALRYSVAQAQKKVTEEQQRSPDKAQMGSTLVAAAIRANDVYVANVGDARCYRLRDGKLKQLSKDHSWVAEQVTAGVLKPTEIKGHPLRSAVTRAIGQAQASSEPDVSQHEWKEHDRLLLCSDGLWDMLSDEKILALLSSEPNPKEAADALVKAANDEGGQDNITVIVVGELPPPPLVSRLTSPRMLPRVLLILGALLAVALVAIGISVFNNLNNGDVDATPEPTLPAVPTVTPRKPASGPPTSAPVVAVPAPTGTGAIPPTATPPNAQPGATPTLIGDTAKAAAPAVAAAPAATAAPTQAAAEAPTTAGVKFCSQLSNNACATSASKFVSGTATVFADWTVPQIKDGTQFRVVWYRNNQPIGSADTCTVQGSTCNGNPADINPGWGVFRLNTLSNPRGNYSFRLFVSNSPVPVLEGKFSVQ